MKKSYLLTTLVSQPNSCKTYKILFNQLKIILNNDIARSASSLSFEIFLEALNNQSYFIKKYHNEKYLLEDYLKIFCNYKMITINVEPMGQLTSEISKFQSYEIISREMEQKKLEACFLFEDQRKQSFLDVTIKQMLTEIANSQDFSAKINNLNKTETNRAILYTTGSKFSHDNDIDENVLINPNRKMRKTLGSTQVNVNNINMQHGFIPHFPVDLQTNLNQKNNEENILKVDEEEKKARIIDEGILKVLKLDQEPIETWKVAYSSKNVNVYQKRTKDSPVVLLKGVSTMIGVPADKALKLLISLELRKDWDDVLANMKLFDAQGKNSDHLYGLFKAPFGISNRDFVWKRIWADDVGDADHVLHMRSVEHIEAPVQKGTVRAHCIISGNVIRTLRNEKGEDIGCTFTLMNQTDIRGLVPKWIVNRGAASAPSKYLHKFRDNALRLIAEGRL